MPPSQTIHGWLEQTPANKFFDTYIRGALDVSGYMHLRHGTLVLSDGDASFNGNMVVQQDTTIKNDLYVENDTEITGILRLHGDASLNSTLAVADDVSLNSKLYVNGVTTVNADILKPGENGGEVTKLRNRLIRMGYLKKTYSPVYDSGLKSAVKKFQGAHGLKSDGIAGKITIAEINIPSSERLKLIVASLERRRWLNKPYDGKYVVVNIPEFKLRIVNKGETTYESKVVVGKNSPSTYTPEFSNKLKYLVINPSWYVPKSIVIEEILPDIRENINASSELLFTDKNGELISREIINFDEFEDEEFPYGMKQPPSLNNPLGQVKFMLPNRHNIHLHDSPSKELFLEEERAFSHGCVRVHEPFKLAYEILKDNIEDPSSVLNDLLENTKEYKLTFKDSRFGYLQGTTGKFYDIANNKVIDNPHKSECQSKLDYK